MSLSTSKTYWCSLTCIKSTYRSWIKYKHDYSRITTKSAWKNASLAKRKFHTWKELNQGKANLELSMTQSYQQTSKPSYPLWAFEAFLQLISKTLHQLQHHSSNRSEKTLDTSLSHFWRMQEKYFSFYRSSLHQSLSWLSPNQTHSVP